MFTPRVITLSGLLCTLKGGSKVPYLAVTFEEPFNVTLATIGWDVP